MATFFFWSDSMRLVVPPPPAALCATYSARELHSALLQQDMQGPADDLFKQSVDGVDFLALTEPELVKDLRLTPFVAKKLVAVRNKLLRV